MDNWCRCFPLNNLSSTCNNTAPVLAKASNSAWDWGVALVALLYIICIIGIIVNVVFVTVLALLIRKNIIPWKKHGLLISLGIGHIVFLSLLLVVANDYRLKLASGEYYGYWYHDTGNNLIMSLLYLSFTSPFVDYVSLCLLQCYALVKPFQYKIITVGKYCKIVALDLTITLCVGLVSVGFYWFSIAGCLGLPGQICYLESEETERLEFDPSTIYVLCLYSLAAILLLICYASVRLFVDYRHRRVRQYSTIQRSESERRRIHSAQRTLLRLGANVVIYLVTILVSIGVRLFMFSEEARAIERLQNLTVSIPYENITCAMVAEKERILWESNSRIGPILIIDVLAELRMIIEPVFHMTFNRRIRSFPYSLYGSNTKSSSSEML